MYRIKRKENNQTTWNIEFLKFVSNELKRHEVDVVESRKLDRKKQ